MNIGVIGAGQWGKNHIRVLKELGLGPYLIVDKDLERLKEINKEFGVNYTTDLSKALENPEIDAFILVTKAVN